MSFQNHLRGVACLALLLAGVSSLSAQATTAAPAPPAPVHRPHIVRPGVNTPGVSRSMADLKKDAVFTPPGSPDWSVVTADSLWVTTGRDSHIVQLVAATNTIGKVLPVKDPCSGVASAFGSLWSPSCGDHVLTRFDPADGKIIAQIPADPANSEGGITVGARLHLARHQALHPRPHRPHQKRDHRLHPAAVRLGESALQRRLRLDLLLRTQPAPQGRSRHRVGRRDHPHRPQAPLPHRRRRLHLDPQPGRRHHLPRRRKNLKLVANIACGIPGFGGEITFGAGHVWATMFDFPLTEIDPATNKVVKQWGGPGGDGLRFGLGSLWLSNGRQGTVWRLSPDQP